MVSMSKLFRPLLPDASSRVCSRVARAASGAAPCVLAAALYATCAAYAVWPCAALAQRDTTTASSASASDQQNDSLSGTARRQKSDAERMLGGPRSAGNPYGGDPYSSNGASPDDAQDALMNEKHMHVMVPSDVYSTNGMGSGKAGASGGASSGKRTSRIGANGISRAGNAAAKGADASSRKSAGYDYGASATSPTAKVYGNPYSDPYKSQRQSSAEVYRSPW
jgi:hypothetical protein